MTSRMAVAWVVTLGLAAGVGAQEPRAVPTGPTREATGSRLAALTEMELRPFPAEAWSHLSAWSGEPITPAAIEGKVVLIVTWSSWYPPSIREGLMLAQRLHERLAQRGLVVVGVHHPKGYEGAAAALAGHPVAFVHAHDATGAFRQALLIDNDPDFYLIDRAGHLRYADVATSAVQQATAALLEETAEEAASLPEVLARQAERARERARRTGTIAESVDLTDLPEVPFTMPDESAFESAAWYKMPEDERTSRYRDQGPLGSKISLPEAGWHPDRPTRQGRGMVLYFWNPAPEHAVSYSVMGQMDILQRAHARDLDVVGVMTPLQSQSRRYGEEDTFDYDAALRRFLANRRLDHRILVDPGGQVMGSIFDRYGGGSRESRAYAVVLSSDGKVRWYGDPRSPQFQGAVDQMLRVDPGIQARRRAEAAFIRGGG